MLPLAGYAERLSVRPGETLRFHVANATGQPVRAQVVRVICADPNPAIGGVRTEPLAVAVETLTEPAPQTVPLGSWAVLGTAGMLAGLASCSFAIRVQPTLVRPRRQVIASCRDEAGHGFEIALTPTLQLCATVGSADGRATMVESRQPLPLHAWTELVLVIDAAAATMRLAHGPVDGHSGNARLAEVLRVPLAAPPAPGAPGRALSLASASEHAPVDSFNGRLEQPRLLGRALGEDEALPPPDAPVADDCRGAWDFAREPQGDRVLDTGPHAHHGRLMNTPTRVVRGSRWTGEEQRFRDAPAHYAAIHFHEDDLDDCRWPATHAITIPADLRSDACALLLEAGDARENIPFFVVPPRGRARATIAVLVSTYTYTVYGNHARPEWINDPRWRQAWIDQAAAWKAYPYNPGEHRDYGLSTYNVHPDGSGIGLVSWRRPMLNLRLGYFTYPYPEIRASGLRHYPADSHLLMWLAHQGYEVDLITDHELHHEGAELLAPYRVVITGSHPEYHTATMLDALRAYRDDGGRLIYLGGNGFYWRIALDPTRDGVIEVRRAEGGIRAWAAEPGEYYHQFDGQYGGLWRRNGRPPQQLVGVGFTAQGNFVGSHYRIDPAARRNPAVSWILEGIEADTIGGEGFSGHGAAGFELDRVDRRQGSPESTVVIASSENHPPEAPWVVVPEEQLTHITTITGESHKALIRADMSWFGCPGGGEVFSVGSITFCGALPVNGFDNPVSRLLYNVVRRFSR
jgi:N,N-dimethylformamidase